MPPGEGFHFHVFGIAIMDVIGTVVAGVALAYYMKWSILLTLFVLFGLGIILHRLFHVRSTVDKLLFKDD